MFTVESNGRDFVRVSNSMEANKYALVKHEFSDEKVLVLSSELTNGQIIELIKKHDTEHIQFDVTKEIAKIMDIDISRLFTGEWSGCNFNSNLGLNFYEPKGTVTSMHDCQDCEKRTGCLMKQQFPVFTKEALIKNVELKSVV